MEPLDVIRSCLPALTSQELAQLRKQLGITMSVCQQQGCHKYVKLGIEQRWFLPSRIRLFCSRCGHSIYI